MEMLSKSLGICITCRHRTHCLSFQNGLRAERAIWDCNEYEHNDSSMANAVSLFPRPQAAGDDVLWQVNDRRNPTGLCLNCDNRGSCMLPVSWSGVWHCEEYV